jgi:hypothetical protein
MAMGLGADPDLPQCGFRFLVSGTWILAPAKAAVCASLLPNAARCAGGARCCPVLALAPSWGLPASGLCSRGLVAQLVRARA